MPKINVAVLLNGITLFNELNTVQRQEIAHLFAPSHYASNDVILSKNSTDDNVYFVCSGGVRVSSFSAQGREASFNDKTAGDYFGELAAIDGGARAADVWAISDVTLLRLSSDSYLSLLARYPSVNRRVMNALVFNIRNLTDRIFEFTAMDVKMRILSEVCRLASAPGSVERKEGANQVLLDPFPKHHELASRVSTTREAVSRVIKQLQNEGLVEKQGSQKLLINDLQKIRFLLQEYS